MPKQAKPPDSGRARDHVNQALERLNQYLGQLAKWDPTKPAPGEMAATLASLRANLESAQAELGQPPEA